MKNLAIKTAKMMMPENGSRELSEWQLNEVINLAKLEGCTMTKAEEKDFIDSYVNKMHS